MDLLNREYQRALLNALADGYPQTVDAASLPKGQGSTLTVNAHYLAEHGLINSRWIHGNSKELAGAVITAKGLDFLQDDGGLGAILGVLTVRLHEDTIRSLLIQSVERSSESATVKATLIQKLRSLPAEGLSTLTTKALELGLANVPDFVHWLAGILPR